MDGDSLDESRQLSGRNLRLHPLKEEVPEIANLIWERLEQEVKTISYTMKISTNM